MPSIWLALWFLLILIFCDGLFPVPIEQPAIGVQWPTTIGGSCDGGMLRLYLPPLHPTAAERKRADWFYKTSEELATARQWHDISFTGAAITDFMAFASAVRLVKAIQADASQEGGIRIYFCQHATLGSLIATLDMLATLNQKRYWLALKSEPMTLYIISAKAVSEQIEPLLM